MESGKKIMGLGLLFLVFFVGCTEPIKEEVVSKKTEMNTESEMVFQMKEIPGSRLEMLNIPIYNLNRLNPLFPNDISEYGFYSLIFESLAEYEDGKMKPLLMESYSIDKESNTLNVKLKEGIMWRDGSSFTTEDVLFSFEMYKSLKESSPYGEWMRSIFYGEMSKNFLKISKIDQNEISFQCNFLPKNIEALLLFPIFQKKGFDSVQKDLKDKEYGLSSEQCIGTGPYYVEKIVPYDNIQLKVNELWHEGEVEIKKIMARVVKNYDANVASFKSGLLDFCFYQDSNWERLIEDKNIDILSYQSNRYTMLGFNRESDFFSQKESKVSIKKAIYAAIDRNKICEDIFSEKAKVANYPEVEFRSLNVNLQKWAEESKIEEYLSDSGYTINKGENLWQKKGKKLELTLAYQTYWEQDYNMALAVKSMLTEKGITVHLIKYIPEETEISQIDLILFSYNGGIFPDDIQLFQKSGLPFLNSQMDISQVSQFSFLENKESGRLFYESYLADPWILPLIRPSEVMLLYSGLEIEKMKIPYNPYEVIKEMRIKGSIEE